MVSEDEVVVESVVFFFLDPPPLIPLPPRLLNHVLGLTKGAIFLFGEGMLGGYLSFEPCVCASVYVCVCR